MIKKEQSLLYLIVVLVVTQFQDFIIGAFSEQDYLLVLALNYHTHSLSVGIKLQYLQHLVVHPFPKHSETNLTLLISLIELHPAELGELNEGKLIRALGHVLSLLYLHSVTNGQKFHCPKILFFLWKRINELFVFEVNELLLVAKEIFVTLLRVDVISDDDLFENHFVLCEGPCFVAEDVIDLSQLLVQVGGVDDQVYSAGTLHEVVLHCDSRLDKPNGFHSDY